jgi:N-acetylglutamate synthase-like GNAT family acetyltransferase
VQYTGTLLASHIRRVFINPSQQQHGLGKIIALELEKKAISQKLPAVDLSASLGSLEFWEHLGFEMQRETYMPVDNNQKLYYFEMLKQLD